MWSVFNPPRHSGQLKSQSLVQFRGFMASSALAKKKKGPKNSVVVKPKKLKLPEQEYQEKTRPLVWAQNFSRDQYELPPVSYKKGKWFVKEGDTERVFAELPELDTSDLTRVTNVVYRKRFSKLVRKFGFLHRVFPTFMPDFFPRINLVVDYPGDNQVFWGNLLDTEDVQVKPTVKFLQPIGRNRVWTLLLVGYDIEKPGFKYLHWAIINIQKGCVEEGECVAEYIPPNPPINTGRHRYIFVLASQTKGPRSSSDIPETWSSNLLEHRHIDVGTTLKSYDLTPKGITFFHVAWHPSANCDPELLTPSGPNIPDKKLFSLLVRDLDSPHSWLDDLDLDHPDCKGLNDLLNEIQENLRKDN
eukprot:TRINITY_DN7644_c0_g2_i5.p1 TRINITY_DN7644_c0_g2~~TRINITY_DN7644_c0_g2_i5.p1  ORF type:complete len:359 (+),score=60.43 TRINITY_DN7644_c0_g2_i5:184-1260(+)